MNFNNEPMFTVKLYGALREKFGKEFRMSARSAASAIRGRAMQDPAFGNAVLSGVFRVLSGDSLKSAYSYTEETIGAYSASDQIIHVIPVAGGAKRGGLFGFLAGIVIMVAAVIMSPWTGGASFAAAMAAETAIFGITYGGFFLFGLGLTLLGVSQMTAKTPRASETKYDRAEDNASAVIDGPQNVASQGAAIPLVYGKMMAGSVLVASSLTAVEY